MFDVPLFRERMLTCSHEAEMGIVALQLAAVDGPPNELWLSKSLSFSVLDYGAVVSAVSPVCGHSCLSDPWPRPSPRSSSSES